MAEEASRIALQEALFHGAGEFCAVVRVEKSDNASNADFRQAAARLLTLTRVGDRRLLGYPPNLYVLVGLGLNVIQGDAYLEALGDEISSAQKAIPGAPFMSDGSDALIQIAAATAADRLLALRLIRFTFASCSGAIRSTFGNKLLNGQEAFGFRDGAVISPEQVTERLSPGHPNGVWILHQQFEQNVDAFCELKPEQRVDVVGTAPSNPLGEGASPQALQRRATLRQQAASPPSDSHYALMTRRALLMVRRGFPYQEGIQEGLSFIAAAGTPEVFATALATMRDGKDHLLSFAQPREGGVYLCPALDWLSNFPAAEAALPRSVLPLRHDVPLVSYTTSEAFVEFMLTMKSLNAFAVEPSSPSAQAVPNRGLYARVDAAIQPYLDRIYAQLEGAIAAKQQGTGVSLRDLQRRAEDAAGAVNESVDEYTTFN